MITSQQATAFYESEMSKWPDFAERVRQLSLCEQRTVNLNGNNIILQHNPARAVSSNAKTDKESIAKRKCFLCGENRPAEQGCLRLNDKFLLLVNPFPILKQHFTLASVTHQVQNIKDSLSDMIDFAQMLEDHIVFYNGPRCGASAPDHLHFQAISKGQLPLETEWVKAKKTILSEWNGNIMEQVAGYGRSLFHLQSSRKEALSSLFFQLYTQFQMREGGQEEPRMNIFVYYDKDVWHLLLFPRKEHRPKQYYAENETYRMVSPGAIDMAGVVVLPRKEDFEKITLKEMQDIYSQVSY